MSMLYELRTYEIPNNNRRVFHERFESHAIRLMKHHGFEIIGCFNEIIGDMQNFTYLLAWQDLNARQNSWSEFNANSEWINIKKESAAKHGEIVRGTSSKILEPTSYSLLK